MNTLETDGYKSFAVLIYVRDSEEEAVMRMYDWKELRFDNDEQLYYTANDCKGRIIHAARQDEMGMTASATLTMKCIEHFRPKYAIMPGIAAGALNKGSEEQMYGDIVLANMVWNYSSGKYVTKNESDIVFGDVGFLPRPRILNIDEEVLPYFEKAIKSEYNENHVFIGALASGSSVVANKSILENHIRIMHIDTKGLEMEGYGLAYAASHATLPKPKAIIAKSVCDFADSRKSDVFQKFAAYTSCEFVKMMIDRILD